MKYGRYFKIIILKLIIENSIWRNIVCDECKTTGRGGHYCHWLSCWYALCNIHLSNAWIYIHTPQTHTTYIYIYMQNGNRTSSAWSKKSAVNTKLYLMIWTDKHEQNNYCYNMVWPYTYLIDQSWLPLGNGNRACINTISMTTPIINGKFIASSVYALCFLCCEQFVRNKGNTTHTQSTDK